MPHRSRQGVDPAPVMNAAPVSVVNGLTDEQVARSAKLIADGIMPFPPDLASADADALACRVQSIRRARLVQFIARVLALDLRHGDLKTPERAPEPQQK